MDLTEQLGNCYLVNGMSDSQIAELMSRGKICKFYKNEIIFREGESGDSVFILLEGRAYLERRVQKHHPVPPTQITVVKQGQIFGEMGFVEGQPRSATARAKGNVVLLELSAEELSHMIQKDADFGIKLMKNLAFILSKRLRRMNDQWLEAVIHSGSVTELEYQF